VGLISRRGFLAQRVPIFPPTASKARQTDPNVPNTAVAGRKLGAPRQALPLEASGRGVGAGVRSSGETQEATATARTTHANPTGILTRRGTYNHCVLKGAPMNRMCIAVAGLVAFLSGAPGTWAFTTQPVNPETMSNRLADPDELADKMSNGQSGGTTFGLPGGARLQFSAPPSGNTASSPFVTSPSTVFVPSEHR
jgi:hypothetical protein